jgi:FSR family fosmidomycin resistance protein-like MFS transporter
MTVTEKLRAPSEQEQRPSVNDMSFDNRPISGKTVARAISPSFPGVSESSRLRESAAEARCGGTTVLWICNFLSKGWEVSILGMLVFMKAKYALPYYMVGILSAVFMVSQISVSFFAGRIAHAIHSRNVILLAIGASAVSWLVLLFSGNVPTLYLAYLFGGVSSGLFEPIGNSLVAKISDSKTRSTAIGNFAAFGDMGRIAVVAAATALVGLLGINHACGVLCASALGALFVVRTFIPPAEGADEAEAREIPVPLADLRKNRKFCLATAAGIADSFSSASLYIFIPLLLVAKGIPLAGILYYNVIFFTGYMSGRLLLGRLADRRGAPQILMASKLVMAGLLVLLTLLGGPVVLGVLLFLLGIFTRGSSPIIRAMVADSIDERVSFHNAFSAYSSASRGSSALCRPIYGFLASLAGIGAVFYVSSVVSLLTLFPAAKYKNGSATMPAGGENRRAAMHGEE